MQLWQMDVMGGIRLAGGAEAKLLTDIQSRWRLWVLVVRPSEVRIWGTGAHSLPLCDRPERSMDSLPVDHGAGGATAGLVASC
jgi:hypothetical protein